MKRAAKRVLEAVAGFAVLPAVLCHRLNSAMRAPERAFAGPAQLLSLAPGATGEYMRRAFYRRTLRGCGTDVCVSFGSLLSHPDTSLGERVYVGPYSVLGNVTVEDDVLIGSHVSVMNGVRQHGVERLDVPIREQPGEYQPVRIGRDTWIGERSVVAADVGRHCVIGAGSVVLRPIPDYAIAVGVPARVIRFRNEREAMEGETPAAQPCEPALSAR